MWLKYESLLLFLLPFFFLWSRWWVVAATEETLLECVWVSAGSTRPRLRRLALPFRPHHKCNGIWAMDYSFLLFFPARLAGLTGGWRCTYTPVWCLLHCLVGSVDWSEPSLINLYGLRLRVSGFVYAICIPRSENGLLETKWYLMALATVAVAALCWNRSRRRRRHSRVSNFLFDRLSCGRKRWCCHDIIPGKLDFKTNTVI